MRWGRVPFWAKDIKVRFSNINAKAEGIENRPAFREAFQRRRCLVPVSAGGSLRDRAGGTQQLKATLLRGGKDHLLLREHQF
jgi:hypothetical protein